MFKRFIGVAVTSALISVGIVSVTTPSVPTLPFTPQFATCTSNCLRVEPVRVNSFGQLTESNDIQPALGHDLVQRTESPQKGLGE